MAETRSSDKRRSATAKRGQAGTSAKKRAKTSDKPAKSGGTRGAGSAAAASRSGARSTPSRSATSRSRSSGTASRKPRRTPSGDGGRGNKQPKRRDSLSAKHARERLSALLGRHVEGMLGVDRDHGNWIVTAEVVELARIPNTTDVLGEYEVILDKDGEVLRYRRTRRYNRGQVDGGQS
ncbi:MAG: hypothetical protein E6G62_10115 [Actinobacteria bacterium]|nr:MAG: hypothetical protein E6G62_10115 [Actinomycetota bacterium]